MSATKEETTVSVRINESVVSDIKEYIKNTGQTINGFISIELRKILNRKLKK